jgi:hypothetical protein
MPSINLASLYTTAARLSSHKAQYRKHGPWRIFAQKSGKTASLIAAIAYLLLADSACPLQPVTGGGAMAAYKRQKNFADQKFCLHSFLKKAILLH